MTIAAVSGGFDPIHRGHIELIEGAAQLGDVLVLLNSDAWLMSKKGFVFQPWDERRAILEALSCVHTVVAAQDDDGTVRTSLGDYHPDYFVNGGDRDESNTPEMDACRELGIRPIFLDMPKVTASSSLVREAGAFHPKPWGSEEILFYGPYVVKRLRIRAGQSTSYQMHVRKQETLIVVAGDLTLQTATGVTEFLPGAVITIAPGEEHRLSGGATGVTLIEASTPELDDVIRLADQYGRVGT